MFEIFFSLMRMYGSSSDDLHALRVGDEVRREVAAVELHALRRPRAWSRRACASSTVMTPSLPTFSIASASMSPIVLVAVGADGADLGDLLVLGRLRHASSATRRPRSTALSMPRLISIGLCPAATSLSPRGRSPARAPSRSSCRRRPCRWSCSRPRGPSARPCSRSLSSSSISLATVTPSLVIVGRAVALLDDDVAALGTEGDLHRVGEGVDARKDSIARLLGVDDFFRCHLETS